MAPGQYRLLKALYRLGCGHCTVQAQFWTPPGLLPITGLAGQAAVALRVSSCRTPTAHMMHTVTGCHSYRVPNQGSPAAASILCAVRTRPYTWITWPGACCRQCAFHPVANCHIGVLLSDPQSPQQAPYYCQYDNQASQLSQKLPLGSTRQQRTWLAQLTACWLPIVPCTRQ